MKILVLDDEKIQVESLKLGLKGRGYKVFGVSNVKEALDCLKNEKIDLVLTDYYMPDSNGIDFLKSLREMNSSIPVIMMSGYGDKNLVIDALNNRCDGFLEKPFTVEKLTEAIENINQRRLRTSTILELGESINRSGIGNTCKRVFDILDVFDSLFEFWHKDLPLQDLLENSIARILSVQWLSEPSMGGIFLSEGDPEMLVLKTNNHFSNALKEECYEVAIGRCHCGHAVTTKKIEFSNGSSRKRGCVCKGLKEYAAYCAPILFGDKVLGVLNVIVDRTHQKNAVDERFLSSVSSILAGIIHRKRVEEERKKTEAKLLHTEKMSAIGTLTGGIAHDFNNLLQVILGFTQLSLLEMDRHHPQYEKLREIERSAQAARQLTRQLLTFCRKIKPQRRRVDLNQEILHMEKMLTRTFPKSILIKLHLQHDLSPISGDPEQIHQVLVNLAINARDAMPTGGTIDIQTQKINLDEKLCQKYGLKYPGEYVLISFTDTGCGIREETMKHIFEPFFTTKTPDKGTGLGLSTAYGIIKSHKGQILCCSKERMGTTFKIYLPVKEIIDKQDYEYDVGHFEGGETILLVDDESAIRRIGKEILGTFGYTVLTANDGREAIETYEQMKDQIDLVILDLLMPGIDGTKCLSQILRINSKAKVLISSGYILGNTIETVFKTGAVGLVPKPFEVKQLLKGVRDALSGQVIRPTDLDYS